MPSAKLFSRSLLGLLIIAVALLAPALFAGFMGDDFMHVALFKSGLPVSLPDDASIYGLFSFMDADPARNRELMNLGLLPWWTYPEMKYAFWRPLSELTHGLDHALWPGNAFFMHAHSITWYLILCVLVLKLFRHFHRALPDKILLVGFALYLLDASHGFTVAWIANRNGLIAATFGVASIYAYVKARDEDNPLLNLWSLLFLGFSLLSAELGVSTIGYLGAYALFIDKRPLLKSCLSALPHILVVVVWWITYKQLGFGAANADAYYLDPVASPIDFLSTLLQRLVVLFGSQWGLVPAEIYGFSGSQVGLANIILGIAIAFVTMTLLSLYATIARHKTARFWLTGALFSAFPVCAALPHDRLLLFIGIGAVGVFLSLLEDNVSTSGHKMKQALLGDSTGAKKGFLTVFFIIHLILSPLLLPAMAFTPKIWASQIDMTPAKFSPVPSPGSKRLVLFNVPISSSMALTIWRFNAGLEIPEAIWPVTNFATPMTIKRLDNSTLIVRKEGGFVQKEEESVRTIETQPFRAGDRINLGELSIRILKVEAGRPMAIEMKFSTSLNNKDLLFLIWDDENKTYRELGLPEAGNTIEI